MAVSAAGAARPARPATPPAPNAVAQQQPGGAAVDVTKGPQVPGPQTGPVVDANAGLKQITARQKKLVARAQRDGKLTGAEKAKLGAAGLNDKQLGQLRTRIKRNNRVAARAVQGPAKLEAAARSLAQTEKGRTILRKIDRAGTRVKVLDTQAFNRRFDRRAAAVTADEGRGRTLYFKASRVGRLYETATRLAHEGTHAVDRSPRNYRSDIRREARAFRAEAIVGRQLGLPISERQKYDRFATRDDGSIRSLDQTARRVARDPFYRDYYGQAYGVRPGQR